LNIITEKNWDDKKREQHHQLSLYIMQKGKSDHFGTPAAVVYSICLSQVVSLNISSTASLPTSSFPHSPSAVRIETINFAFYDVTEFFVFRVMYIQGIV
jgi:hypothetical protein